MERDPIFDNGSNKFAETPRLNAREFVMKYLHFSWLFVATVVVSMIIAWVYLRYSKPVYSVSSTLLIRNDNAARGNSGGMNSQDMFSDIALFQSNTNKQNEILILSSRSMMERVVKSLGLQKRYAVVGNVKTTDIYPSQPFDLQIIELADSTKSIAFEVHFSADWKTFTLGNDKREWVMEQEMKLPEGSFKIIPRASSYSTTPFRDFTVEWMPMEQAANHCISKLEVKPANDLSNVLSLSYVNENPVLASAVVNTLMQQYNDAAIEDKNEINRKILSFINDRLRLVEFQLDSVEVNLQRYRTSRDVIDISAQSEMYFGNISELNQNLRKQEIQLQVAELLEDYLTQPSNRLSLVPSTLGLDDPTLIELTTAYNRLVSERLSELQTGATVDNPVVRNLEKNIEEARVKMVQNLANIKQVYRNSIRSLGSQTGSIRKEISSIPEKERQSRERARQQEIKQNLYLYLLQKREESEISQASTIASSRIIDTALPAFNRVSPIPLKIYGIALLVGLLVPIIVIYIRELLNDKVTTKDDIVKVTRAPIVGEVGHSDEESTLLFPQSSRTIVAEQMRILRSNLKFVLAEKAESPTLLVTSSFSGEGKSFISTNLGATLALSGKRTVILEFDLRKPKILAGLGIPKGNTNGLTNYLVGSARPEDLTQSVPQIEGLFVISCGPVPPNPSEILLAPKVDELFKWLKANFDAIVIDTAPVGLVSDSFTLSRFADATIYVVRQRYTYKRQIKFVQELYDQQKLPNIGLLVNDVIPEGARGYYGYGGGYGYGYGYGYGRSGGDGYYSAGNTKRRTIFNFNRRGKNF